MPDAQSCHAHTWSGVMAPGTTCSVARSNTWWWTLDHCRGLPSCQRSEFGRTNTGWCDADSRSTRRSTYTSRRGDYSISSWRWSLLHWGSLLCPTSQWDWHFGGCRHSRAAPNSCLRHLSWKHCNTVHIDSSSLDNAWPLLCSCFPWSHRPTCVIVDAGCSKLGDRNTANWSSITSARWRRRRRKPTSLDFKFWWGRSARPTSF